MFLRSKVQEMILRRRSRSMNGGCAHQGEHLSSQHANSSTTPRDGGGGKGGDATAPFASPRLLHCSSLPARGRVMPGAETAMFSMSPTSVLDASAAFACSPVDGKRRPWCDGCAGLADALDCAGLADGLDCADDEQRQRKVLAVVSTRPIKAQTACLVRSCSLDRRVEFGIKNKSSWLPLRAGRAEAAVAGEMEPSSEDYTCVISRGPNPRTVHIFGDRVFEGDRESSPRPINLPARGDRGFLSL